MTGRMPEYMSDEMSENMSDRMPDRLPDRMPGGMSGYMPDRMPEYMSNRMSKYTKYMSKYTSWHVMVGITGSRVIFLNRPDFQKIQLFRSRPAQEANLLRCGLVNDWWIDLVDKWLVIWCYLWIHKFHPGMSGMIHIEKTGPATWRRHTSDPFNRF